MSSQMSSQMEIETKQERPEQQPAESAQPERMEDQPEQIEEPPEKQEFKDFSLNPDVLIYELSEKEIAKLFPAPKKVSESVPILC